MFQGFKYLKIGSTGFLLEDTTVEEEKLLTMYFPKQRYL